jgi:hypothetical protein
MGHADLPFKFTASVRCACGFRRDWHTNDRAQAEAQVEEWQNEHAACRGAKSFEVRE